MARHPWVAKADEGVRFGIQVGATRRRGAMFAWELHENPLAVILEAGTLVESLGFDGLFVHDHPALSPDPWLCLGALGAVTRRVRLGSVVNCVYYRHPAYLARQAADLDHLSRGRLMLGLGVGWAESEFRALGVSYDPARRRLRGLEEALAIIQGVWGPEPFSFQGEVFSTESMHVAPPPLQPCPPIMIAGDGERVTLRQVAQLADACNFEEAKLPGGVDDIPRKFAVLRRHCEEAGRPYDEILRSHFLGWLILAPTESTVRAKLARYFPHGVPPSLDSFVVSGTPSQAIDYFARRVEAGMQYFVVQLPDGSDHETLHLLAGEVAPQVV